MDKSELSKYNINDVKEIYHNISYQELFEHETREELAGYERGIETDLGAITVDTGVFTGRSPKDKYIVKNSDSENNVWWASEGRKGSDNKAIDIETWQKLLAIGQKQLSGKKLYVTDAYCGANENTRLKIRMVSEVAWQAHFVKNMFIRPSEDELKNFEPDFIIFNACKATNTDYKSMGLNSEVFVAFNLTDKMAVIGGTWYGGEMKKGAFSVMNYFLPLQGIASMHCSANKGKNGDTAIFFGLSGTGKTTLSTDPDRMLIGDDEHGWDDEGVFNFEGGCYAKTINLDKDKEPDIFGAIRRDALLENVVYDEKTKVVDFSKNTKTENTRVSYPIYHIDNIVKPISKGTHPSYVIFLTADAFGVLPPVSALSKEQAMYHFLSGYTAKVAGTERGITEPVPTFSAAFGAAFLLLHPTKYAVELAKKIDAHNVKVYLVNTGWNGGKYGVGKRIDLKSSRAIITAIINGSLDNAEYNTMDVFNLKIPKSVAGVDSKILNPRLSWKNTDDFDKTARELAIKFIENFQSFEDSEVGKGLVSSGPVL